MKTSPRPVRRRRRADPGSRPAGGGRAAGWGSADSSPSSWGSSAGSRHRPRGLPVAGWHALATLAALVPLLVLDVLPDGVLALLLPALWVLGGVTSPRVALSGFASPSWVLVVSVLAVG